MSSIKLPVHPTPASVATHDLIGSYESKGWRFTPVVWTGGEGSDTPPASYWLYKAPLMETQGLTRGLDFTEHDLLDAYAQFMVRQRFGARLGIAFAEQQALLIADLVRVGSLNRHPDGEFPDWITVPSFTVSLKDTLPPAVPPAPDQSATPLIINHLRAAAVLPVASRDTLAPASHVLESPHRRVLTPGRAPSLRP